MNYVSTLVNSMSFGELEDDITGNLSALLRVVAIFISTFRVVSPVSRLGVLVVGGTFSIVMISSATCL